MIPFLKKKQEASVSGPVDEVKVRKPDEEMESFGIVDAIVDDIAEFVKTGNKSILKQAIESLIDHIKEQDEVQDESLEY